MVLRGICTSAGKRGGGGGGNKYAPPPNNDAHVCELNFITMQNKITVKPVLSRHCIEQPLKTHIRPVKDIL